MFKTFYTTFHLGPIPIQFWGFFVALGMLLTFLIVWKRGEKLKMDTEEILDLCIWMIVGGIITARFFHIFFYNFSYYMTNPLDMVKIWQGGMSSFGGLAGAVMTFFVFVKKKKIALEKLPAIKDLIAFGTLYGFILGRVGCVAIHDHLGRLSNIYFLTVQSTSGARLDMAWLEILLLLPLAIVFFVQRNKKMIDGWYLNIFMIYYGALRFGLDFLRATDIASPDARYMGLTPAQYFGILLVLVGGRYFYKLRKKI